MYRRLSCLLLAALLLGTCRGSREDLRLRRLDQRLRHLLQRTHRQRARTRTEPAGQQRVQQALEMFDDLASRMRTDQPSWTDLKRQMSTRDGIARIRERGPDRAFQSDSPGTGTEGLQRARQHLMDVYEKYPCAEPRPQLVRVSDVYRSSQYMYLPSSVELNHCSDRHGCCYLRHGHTCTGTQTRTVRKTFLVTTPAGTRETFVEEKEFTEDVACGCRPRSSAASAVCPATSHLHLQLPMDQPSSSSSEPQRVSSGNRRQHGLRTEPETEPQPTAQTCRCTEEFVSRTYPNGTCKCDCFDGNKKCIRVKRGKTYLDEKDNRCVKRGRCDPPDCTYGTYRAGLGRCPRRHEKRHPWQQFTV